MGRWVALVLCGWWSIAGGSEPLSPVVFIHGIKGATLAESGGKLHWLTAGQALGLGAPDLALPLEWAGDTQKPDALRAGEILRQLRFIPFLWEEKIYGPWLDLAAGLGRAFYPFAYDWRRDNLETVSRFEKFLDTLRRETGAKDFQVVAHSMGGLITLALLNRRPDLFHGVVFAGVPFRGGIGFLVDLHRGLATGLNQRILSEEVLATFPSVYSFFPLQTEALRQSDGNPEKINFYSVADWKEKGLGLFATGKTVPAGFEPFLQKALVRALEFRRLLVAKAQPYPPVLVISGNQVPTLAQIQHQGPKSVRGWDFETLPRQPGDGRILTSTSLPPDGIPYRVFYSGREHAQLLNDPAVLVPIRELF